jgi:hypothetical protein
MIETDILFATFEAQNQEILTSHQNQVEKNLEAREDVRPNVGPTYHRGRSADPTPGRSTYGSERSLFGFGN